MLVLNESEQKISLKKTRAKKNVELDEKELSSGMKTRSQRKNQPL
jgi:hypothetical protein